MLRARESGHSQDGLGTLVSISWGRLSAENTAECSSPSPAQPANLMREGWRSVLLGGTRGGGFLKHISILALRGLAGNRQRNEFWASLGRECSWFYFVLIFSPDEKFAMVREASNKQNCD